ncbi:MAG TPA: phage antirepressor N-terminal domain-containing protein [Ktedonobacterales bacterium]|jgi:hypothetical protein
MVKTSRTPIIPFKQAMIRIAGYEILAICTADGNTAAGVRMICDLLGVDRPSQIHKLQTDSAFRDCLILAQVEIAGKQRVAHFIIAEFIPLWLKGIEPSRVKPEARETVEELRSVAVQALRAFFFPGAKTQQQSTPLPKPEAHPLPPPDLTSVSVYDLLRAIARHTETVANHLEQEHGEMEAWKVEIDRAVINRLEQEHREMEAWKAQIDRQRDQEAAWKAEMQHQLQLQREQTEVLWSVVLGNASASEEALSADQQQALQLLLHHQHKLTGQPRATIQRELLAVVGVAGLSHLQQKDWKQVLAWFRQRQGW